MISTLRGRIVTCVVMGAATLGVFYIGFYAPRAKELGLMRSELERERLKIVRMRQKNDEYKEVQEEYDLIDEELLFLEEHLLSRDEISSFFNELSLRGKTYGIEYVSIVPEKIASQEYYDRVPVRMQIYASYHALGEFLSDIARRPKMGSLVVENIEMTGIGSKKPVDPKDEKSHTAEVNLSMFVYARKDISHQSVEEGEQARANLSAGGNGLGVNAQTGRTQSRRT